MSDIRKCFISRYPEGKIVEADFSQLEVVVQAMLTGSANLINDIATGADMHRQRAAKMFGIPEADVTPAQRQAAKACSFQLAYGAGYKSMAAKLKLPEKLTKAFVDEFFKRYPEIKEYNTLNMKQIELSSKPSSVVDKAGVQLRRGYMSTPLGRTYSFLQKEFMGSYTFSPTDVSNYPIQGTAADIVAVFRAKLYRALINLGDDAEQIVPICTVHDSVVFDCATDEALDLLIAVLDCLMQNLNALLRELFPALKTPLQLKLDVKAGKDWMEQKKIASLPTGNFA